MVPSVWNKLCNNMKIEKTTTSFTYYFQKASLGKTWASRI